MEVVLNMFAGAGCFSILIAKYSNAEKVFSIDVNPSAVLMKEFYSFKAEGNWRNGSSKRN